MNKRTKWTSYTLALCALSLFVGETAHARPLLYGISSSPFANNTVRNVGDLLTIIVEEAADATDKGENKNELKEDSGSSVITRLLESYLTGNARLEKALLGRGSAGDIKKIDAKGENKNSHTFTATIQARVVEVVAPGQFLIRGAKKVSINGKSKEIFISGIIRQQDIGRNKGGATGYMWENAICSSYLADAQVEIDGEMVSKDLQPGFFSRLMHKLF